MYAKVWTPFADVVRRFSSTCMTFTTYNNTLTAAVTTDWTPVPGRSATSPVPSYATLSQVAWSVRLSSVCQAR